MAMTLINQAMMFLARPSSSSCGFAVSHRLCPFSGPTRSTIGIKVKKQSRGSCHAALVRNTEHDQATRRVPSLLSNVWDYNDLLSLSNGYSEEDYREELKVMKEQVRDILVEARNEDPLALLKLIDVIQQLGLQYHFEEEIQRALEIVHQRGHLDSRFAGDLYATSLRFRILRQQGFQVPQDVFKCFMNKAGTSKESLHDDVEGLLSMYEASYLGITGEMIVDEAIGFSCKCLEALDKGKLPKRLAERVNRALDMPMHWRPNRLQARWFIDVYQENPNMNSCLLKLAKLDFNIVQSVHMKEIRRLVRWWVELDVTKRSIGRDAVMENYMFNVLMAFDIKYGAFREMNTKICLLIGIIDDIYDVFGHIDELELLTDFIARWDISEIEKLPTVIKTGFLVLYNTTNEMGYSALVEKDLNIIPYLQKAWADQSAAYLVEAKWQHDGLMPPSLNEYLDTAVASIGGIIIILCWLMATEDTLTKEKLDYFSGNPRRIMYNSVLILRLLNDLATSRYGVAEADNPKSVACYMREAGVSEEVARQHIEGLICEAWKTMNEDAMTDHHPLPRTFVQACLDHARGIQFFYDSVDGHNVMPQEVKDAISSVLLRPVPMTETV